MGDVKIDLLGDVTVPREGTNETQLHEAGETISVSQEVADRLIRIGAAEEPEKKSEPEKKQPEHHSTKKK